MTATGEQIQNKYDYASLCVYDAFEAASEKDASDVNWISWVGYFAAIDAPSVENQFVQLNKAITDVVNAEVEDKDTREHLRTVRMITQNVLHILDNDDVKKVDADEVGMNDIREGAMEFRNLIRMVDTRLS